MSAIISRARPRFARIQVQFVLHRLVDLVPIALCPRHPLSPPPLVVRNGIPSKNHAISTSHSAYFADTQRCTETQGTRPKPANEKRYDCSSYFTVFCPFRSIDRIETAMQPRRHKNHGGIREKVKRVETKVESKGEERERRDKGERERIR